MPVAQPLMPESATPVALPGYEILEREQVLAFLAARPHLESVLEEAPRRVERAFGKKLPLRLRIFRDREESGSAELVVEIVSGKVGADAWKEGDRNLRRLHEQWLVAVPREVTRDLLFVTEPA